MDKFRNYNSAQIYLAIHSKTQKINEKIILNLSNELTTRVRVYPKSLAAHFPSKWSTPQSAAILELPNLFIYFNEKPGLSTLSIAAARRVL